MTLKETAFELSLPFTATEQVQDGCVTASARGILVHLGVNFETDFLPELHKRYSLDLNNLENNHFLGVAAIAVEKGYTVVVHTKEPLSGDGLPSNAPSRAKEVHPKVIADLKTLEKDKPLSLESGILKLEDFQRELSDKLSKGFYCMAILEWDKWNEEAQAKFGNPRHIIAIVGMNNDQVLTMDPSISMEKQPVTQPVQKLFQALWEQWYVFIGQSEKQG